MSSDVAGAWLLPPAADDLPEQRLLAGELTERVRLAMASLPPAQREVVTLRDIEGWTSEEGCRLLELSEANQRVLLHRGRSKVRAALEAYLAHERPLWHQLSHPATPLVAEDGQWQGWATIRPRRCHWRATGRHRSWAVVRW